MYVHNYKFHINKSPLFNQLSSSRGVKKKDYLRRNPLFMIMQLSMLHIKIDIDTIFSNLIITNLSHLCPYIHTCTTKPAFYLSQSDSFFNPLKFKKKQVLNM